MSCGFQKREKEYGETIQLSSYCHILSKTLEGTSGGSHDTKRHHPPGNAGKQHQQTSGLPFDMLQTVIENSG